MKWSLFLLLGILFIKSGAQPKKLESGFYYVVNSGGQVVGEHQGSRNINYRISKIPFCSIKNIASASKEDDVVGRLAILLVLSKKGARIIKEVSKKYTGKRIAFVVNGKIISTPTVMGEFESDRLVITEDFSIGGSRKNC